MLILMLILTLIINFIIKTIEQNYTKGQLTMASTAKVNNDSKKGNTDHQPSDTS